MSLTPLSGNLGKKRAAHLLRRACFGATKDEVDAFADLTPAEAVKILFPAELPDINPPIDPQTANEWVYGGTSEASSESFELMQYFLNWWIGQMLSSGVDESKSLGWACRERLIFYLHTHFTTQQSIVGDSRAIFFQNQLFRFFAFDKNDHVKPGDPENINIDPESTVELNMKELTKKISVDNAMLRFLDGRLNVKGSPNENYARELMELFVIGRGLEGSLPEPAFEGDYFNYTEQDVQAGARVLSGFNIDASFSNIDEDTELPRGVIKGNNTASAHDNDQKTFSVRFSNHVIQPDEELLVNGSPNEASVLDEISQLVELLFDQRETAKYQMRKLYRYYVYHEINQDKNNSIIEDLADIYTENNFKLQPVLEQLFVSEEFYENTDDTNDDLFGSLIKSPLDLVIGFTRSLGTSFPTVNEDPEAFYQFTGRLRGFINLMGLNLYEPPEVAGYPAYHQFPGFNRNWINTNYLTYRYNFIQDRIGDGFTVQDGRVHLLNFVNVNFEPSVIQDAKALILSVVSYFLPNYEESNFDNDDNGELTNSRLNFFYQEFMEKEGLGDTGEDAWRSLWQTENYNEAIAGERLSFLFNAILQTPEYQLM